MLKKNNLQITLIQLGSGVFLAVSLLAGLTLIQENLESLFEIIGVDVAIPGDKVGELDIQSTREVILNEGSLLQLLVGFVIIALAIFIVQRINTRWLRTSPNHAHSESELG